MYASEVVESFLVPHRELAMAINAQFPNIDLVMGDGVSFAPVNEHVTMIRVTRLDRDKMDPKAPLLIKGPVA
jgi:hypothetical protein